MTDGPSPFRRQFLAAIGTGVAAVGAGCGYQPAGGELDWRDTVGGARGLATSSDERWLSDGETLFRIYNRSGRTFDHDASGAGFVSVHDAQVTAYGADGTAVWTGSTDTQYAGMPAVADGRVYLPLEDGRVTALERASSDDSTGAASGGATVRWTRETGIDRAESRTSIRVHAGSAFVVDIGDERLVALDATDGDVQFTLGRETFDGRRIGEVTTANEWLWVAASGGDGPDPVPRLYGISHDGNVRATVSLSARPDWLETVGSTLLLGVDGDVWAVTVSGDRRFTIPLEGGTDGTPLVVDRSQRLYHYGAGTLEAIDVVTGDRAWHRDDTSFRDDPVADAAGIYGRGTGPESDGCGFVAVTGEGDRWWSVPPLAELDCSGDLFLVDDRLVVVAGDDLYGFRTTPGRRLSVVG